jgi:hypothetical protein
MAAIHHPGMQLPVITWPQARPRRRPLPASVYRRRRLAVAAVLLSIVLAAGWAVQSLGRGPLTTSDAGARSVTVLPMETVARTTYVVAPGDTLWSIARQLAPEGDVRPVVDSLAAHRHGRPLQVGEVIALP